jgi:CheY-like chemotaxis protein
VSAASAEDYPRSNEHGTSSCLITDVQMPGMSGADLQAQLIAEGNFTPIIFMTAFDKENIRAPAGSRSVRVPEKALSRWRPCSMEKALKTLKTRAPCEVAALDEVIGAAGPQVEGGRVIAEISVSSRGARKMSANDPKRT